MDLNLNNNKGKTRRGGGVYYCAGAEPAPANGIAAFSDPSGNLFYNASQEVRTTITDPLTHVLIYTTRLLSLNRSWLPAAVFLEISWKL